MMCLILKYTFLALLLLEVRDREQRGRKVGEGEKREGRVGGERGMLCNTITIN